jgi:hypothetical protein
MKAEGSGRIPLNLYIPKGEEKFLPLDWRKLLAQGISAVWLDVGPDNTHSHRLETLPEGPPRVYVLKDRNPGDELVQEILDRNCAGIAVEPCGVKSLLRHVETIEKRRMPLYLMFTAALEGIERGLDVMNGALTMLRKCGLTDITILSSSGRDRAALFNLHGYFRDKLGLKGGVSVAVTEDAKELRYSAALMVGSLIYEGMADTVLLVPPEAGKLSSSALQCTLSTVKQALRAIGHHPFGYRLISCPTCGRCEIDIPDLAERVDRVMKDIERRNRDLERSGGITVAVMGCNVNGPGEAREADIGIAGGRGGTGTIFTCGKPVATLAEDRLLPEFRRMAEKLIRERHSPKG